MSVFLAIGFPSTGAAGFWTAIACVQQDKAVGIMFFSSGTTWRIISLTPSTALGIDRPLVCMDYQESAVHLPHHRPGTHSVGQLIGRQ
jgi:hypothetical protein